MNQDYLNALADHFGILPTYNDFDGQAIHTSSETQLALLRANGLVLDNAAMVDEAYHAHISSAQDRWFPKQIIVEADQRYECQFGLGSDWHIILDDLCGDLGVAAPAQNVLSGRAKDNISLPPLPAGLHDLVIDVSGRQEHVLVISAPSRAPSVEELTGKDRIWGVNAALYGLASERNFGLGDFEDLAGMAELVTNSGASFLGINPVHAWGFGDMSTISPYSPSHRGFFNSQYIALDQLSGLEHLPQALEILEKVRAGLGDLKDLSTIDYARHREVHSEALKQLFAVFVTHAPAKAKEDFSRYCSEQGEGLESFALYEAIGEKHGQDWRLWPDELREKDLKALEQYRVFFKDRVEFHRWLQWIADGQLAEAQRRAKGLNSALGLYLDLAVGARQVGAESWCEAESVAQGVSLGAPPDHLSPHGQCWGLTAYAPQALFENKYCALRQTYRQAMRHAGVLRIDHVLGLNRSFWIPDDGSPGAYVLQPLDALMAILAIEAQASQTVVIGEDLGLVPDGFREQVASRGIYSYSVLQYEKKHDGSFKKPAELRPFSLACFATHDTPTLRGYMTGRDLEWWQKLGGWNEGTMLDAMGERARDVDALTHLDEEAVDEAMAEQSDYDQLFRSVHCALAKSPVSMISVQLDDILGLREAQNLPGTIDEHPNWRVKYPQTLDMFRDSEVFQFIGSCMSNYHR